MFVASGISFWTGLTYPYVVACPAIVILGVASLELLAAGVDLGVVRGAWKVSGVPTTVQSPTDEKHCTRNLGGERCWTVRLRRSSGPISAMTLPLQESLLAP